MAILQRPLFPGTRPEETVRDTTRRLVDLERQSIWISYCSTAMAECEPSHLRHFGSHHRLAVPMAPWEELKIGAGTPPILSRHGWLTIYHGVSAASAGGGTGGAFFYSAGVLVLAEKFPHLVLYRSREPVLTPQSSFERTGTVGNVVFPTGIDRRDDLGSPDRFDVYYGMADNRIGVARLDVPERLPQRAFADRPQEEA